MRFSGCPRKCVSEIPARFQMRKIINLQVPSYSSWANSMNWRSPSIRTSETNPSALAETARFNTRSRVQFPDSWVVAETAVGCCPPHVLGKPIFCPFADAEASLEILPRQRNLSLLQVMRSAFIIVPPVVVGDFLGGVARREHGGFGTREGCTGGLERCNHGRYV
ncbi:hypothetical protein PDESU_03136 [Pontiella desulfatans]|uniref:Uncharacterized protein n=1 Tax=Pontiella desulfatans TaxID=2750659 RepID=A0A6C2U3V8_PONDE|nr:hypothetical protein PDESU_03136 [Pontiella desulfatans]